VQPSRVHVLSIHADYACQRSGACCAAGWTIPIDRLRQSRIERALAAGQLTRPAADGSPFILAPDLPEDAGAILVRRTDGACVFLAAGDRAPCAVQRDLDHDALPVACQQFPRISLTDARGVFVTLSHYCPTAARLLVRNNVPLEIATLAPDRAYEGLDARGTLPPLLNARVLMDWASYDRWEQFLILVMGEGRMPEDALARIVAVTERLRAWTPAAGSLMEAVEAASGDADAVLRLPAWSADAVLALHQRIVSTIPEGLPRPAPPQSFAADLERLVAPVWSDLRGPICRYLAAKGFASWFAYQGRGLRTIVAGMIAALVELQIEAARAASRTGRRLDEKGLLDAIRAADLTLVHHSDGLALARALSAFEDRPLAALLAPLGSIALPV
jgi:Fe-S-cluster containining protein